MYVFLGWLVLSILLAAMALGLPCRSVHKPKAFEDKYVTTIWNSNVHFVNPKSAKTEQTDLHSTTALIPSVSIGPCIKYGYAPYQWVHLRQD
jgi:nitrate reductase gamma subunit